MINLRSLTFVVFSIGITPMAHAMQTNAMQPILQSMMNKTSGEVPKTVEKKKENKNHSEKGVSESYTTDQDIFSKYDTMGVDPNTITLPSGQTILHVACAKDRLDIIKKLSEYELFNPNVQDKEGDTALHYACRNGNYEIAEMLVQLKTTNLAIKNKAGATPLDLAQKMMTSFDDEKAQKGTKIYGLLMEAMQAFLANKKPVAQESKL